MYWFSGIIYFNRYNFNRLNILVIEIIIEGLAEMSIPEKPGETRDELLGALIRAEKNLTRSSVVFRSVIASAFGLNVTDAECVDYLMENCPN
jgi:hypothetical protein